MPRSGKNTKSKTPRASVSVSDWESKLYDLKLDDDMWKMSVSILSPSLLVESEIISIFTAGVINGQRQKFTVITYEDVLSQIFSQCKVKSTKDAPEFYEICGVAKAIIDSTNMLDPQTLSKVLKFIFNNIKTQDIKQQSLKKSVSKISQPETMKKKENPKDKKSGAKTTKLQEPPVNKEKSKLYKRGEEVLEEKYLGDEPDNGICRYILLVNFEKCGLIEELCRLQIDVHSIIRLHVNDQKRLQVLITKQKAEKMWGSKGSEQDLEQMKSEQETLLLAEKQLQQYWRVTSILMRDHVYDRLGNIATLDYNVKSELLPDDLNGAENRASFGASMFNEIATILYDLIDFRRQWQNYLEHIKVIHIPLCPPLLNENNQPVKISKQSISLNPDLKDKSEDCREVSVGNFVDMRYYNEVLEGLPIESTSVELILHALLEQVTANENEILPKSALIDEKARKDGLNPHIARNIANEVDKLFLTEEERTRLSEEMPLHIKSIKSQMNTSPFTILHPYDENQYKKLFATHNVENPEELMKLELNLCSQQLPSILNSMFNENTTCEWKSDLQIDKLNGDKIECDIIKESLKQMQEVRFHQIMQFSEKYGFTQEEFKHYFSKLQLESLRTWKTYSIKKPMQQTLNKIQPLGYSSETLIENRINPTTDQLLDNTSKNNNQLQNLSIPFDDPYLLYESLSALFIKIEYEINRMLKFSLETDATNENHQHSSVSLSVHSSSSLLYSKERSRSLSSVSSTNRKSSLSSRQSTGTSRKESEVHTTPTSVGTSSRTKSTSSRRSSSAVHFDIPNRSNKSISFENEDQKCKFDRLTSLTQELREILKQLQITHQMTIKSDKEKKRNNFAEPSETCKISLESFNKLFDEARNIHLNEWSVEEKLEPNHLLQRLHSLNYEKPYLDVYKRKHDNSLLIVSHHPFDRTIRSNHHTWSSWFHVNKLGFRPYLQLIEAHIRNWTREQEAIYEAAKLSAEILQDNDTDDPPVEQSPTKQKKKNSPKTKKTLMSKRNRSVSGSESDASITQGEIKSLLGNPNEFILPGSLKAVQKEQELIKLKKDSEESRKEVKRVKSAKKHTEREISPTEKKSIGKPKKSPNSKSPVQKNIQDDEVMQTQQLQTNKTSEEFWPFTGYDVSNLLPHLTGEVTHMFPTDGGTIKTQRNEIPTGEATLRVSLIKDGHVFTIHKIDGPPEPNIPNENSNEVNLDNQENEVHIETTEKPCDGVQEGYDGLKNFSLPELYSSITACFSDGICLTMSKVNNTNSESNSNCYSDSIQLNRLSKSNDGDINKENQISIDFPNVNDNKEGKQINPLQKSIYLSTPDGAQVTVYHCINEISTSISYECEKENIPLKDESGYESNECRNNRSSSLQYSILLKLTSPNTYTNGNINVNIPNTRSDKEYELTRFITSDGIVIQVLMPGCTSSASYAIKILYPDGAIMERGTAVSEELRISENPQFTLNSTQEDKQQREINIQPELVVPTVLQMNSVQSRKTPIKKKSAKKRIEEKRADDDVRNETGPASTNVPTLVTPSSTPRSLTDDPDDNLPWLITLLSGERFWFKQIKLLTNISNSFDSTPTTNVSDRISQESVVLDSSSSKRSNDTMKYEVYPSTSVECFRAYDPATGETLYTRPEDGLIAVEPHPDSPFKLIVQHADGTRLTQILLATEKPTDECNLEDQNLTLNKPQMFIRTECIGFPAVVLNKSTGEFELSLFGKIFYTSQSLEIINLNEPTIYEMRSKDMESLLECTDPHKNVYTVDSWANCNVLLTVNDKKHTVDDQRNIEDNQIDSTELATENEQNIHDSFHLGLLDKKDVDNNETQESRIKEVSPNTCCLYDEHIPRLFYFDPIKKTAIELIHQMEYNCLLQRAHNIQSPRYHMKKMSVEEKLVYMNTENQKISTLDNPFSGGLYLREAIQNNPKVFGVTLMKTITTNETGKYYVQENIIPEGLSSHDFQTLTRPSSLNVNSDTHKLGEKAGKGLDIIMPSLEYLGLKLPETNVTLLPLQKGKSIRHENQKFRSYQQPFHANVRQFTEFPLITSEINQRFLGVLYAYTEYYVNRLNEWCSQQPMRLSEIMQTESGLFLDPISSVSNMLPIDKQISDTTETENMTDESSSPSQQTIISQEISQTAKNFSPARQAAFESLRQEIEKAARDRAALRTLTEQSISVYSDTPPNIPSPLLRSIGNENELNMTNMPLDTDHNHFNMNRINNINNNFQKKLTQNDVNGNHIKIPTKKTMKNSLYYYDIDPLQIEMNENLCAHVPLDDVALAKHKRLRVPKYLYAKRPSLSKYGKHEDKISYATDINVQQALIEDPVRRRALFTSIIGGPPFGQLSLRRMRGLRLAPSRIHVGLLSYGEIRNFSAKLINWGPETAHFRIKQLPIHSGIRVFYTPGPIPAGLSRQLTIEVSNQLHDRLERYPFNVQDDEPQQQIGEKYSQSNVRWCTDKYSQHNSKDIEKNGYDVNVSEQKDQSCGNKQVNTFSEHLRITTDTHIMYLLITGSRMYDSNRIQSPMIPVNEEIIKPTFILPLTT
ncbi:Sperm-associated antigen 17 [Schistosoma japonicum]|nr:Sperm-associated antigen 17 [Schistosoma japonicum]